MDGVILKQYLIIGLRGINKHYWQALLAILGISLAVSFSVGVNKIVGTVNRDFVERSRGTSQVDISIYHKRSYWFNSSEIIPILAKNPLIHQYSGIASLSVSGSSLSLPVDQNEGTREFEDELFFIYGIDPETFPDWDAIPMFIGVKSISDNRILLSKYLALKYDLLTNESFFVDSQEIIVGGIFDNYAMNKIGMQNSKNMIIVNVDWMREFFGKSNGEVTSIVLTVTDFLQVEQVYQQLVAEIGDEYTIVIEHSLSFADKLTLSSFGTTLSIVILIAMIVEFIFLLNLFLILVNYHQRNIGLLKSFGCKNKHLSIIFLSEISLYGVMGSVIGLLVGDLVSTKIMEFLLESEGLSISSIPSLNMNDLGFALELGWGVSILAAIYPLLHLLRLPIVRTLQERSHLLTSLERDTIAWKVLVTVGMFFLLFGVLLTWQSVTRFQLDVRIDNTLAISLIFIFMGLFSLQLLSLWLFPVIFNFIAKSTSSAFLTLATRNITRYRVKSMAAVATNAIAMAFVLTIIIMTATLMQQVPTWYQQSYPNIDLIVETKNDDPFSLQQLEYLQANQENFSIRSFTHLRYQKAVLSTSPDDPLFQGNLDLFHVFGVDPESFSEFSFPLLEGKSIREIGSWNDSGLVPTVITDHVAKRFDLKIGSTFQMVLLDVQKKITFIVEGMMQSPVFTITSSTFQVFIAEQALQEVIGEEIGVKYLLLKLENPELEAEVETALLDVFPNILEIYSTRNVLARIQRSLDRQDVFLKALTYQAILMAALTQFITILLSAERTRREIGITRAEGLDQRGVMKIFLFEGLQLGLIAMFLGWLDGVVASILIGEYLKQIIAPIALQFPLVEMVMWSFLYFGIIILATFYPGWRTSRLSVIRSLDLRPQLFPTQHSFSVNIRMILDLINRQYLRHLSRKTVVILLFIGTVHVVLNVLTSLGLHLVLFLVLLFIIFRLMSADIFEQVISDIVMVKKNVEISAQELTFQQELLTLLESGTLRMIMKEILLVSYFSALFLVASQLVDNFFLMFQPPPSSSQVARFFPSATRIITPSLLWLLLMPFVIIIMIMLANAIMNGVIVSVLGEKLAKFLARRGVIFSGIKILQLSAEVRIRDIFYDDTVKITSLHVLLLTFALFLNSLMFLFLPRVLFPMKNLFMLALEMVIVVAMMIRLNEELTRKYLQLAAE